MSFPEPTTRRLFVAVRPSPEVTSELRRLVAAVAEEVDPPVRWSPPAGYHVTLRYIGPAEVAPIVDALDAVLPTDPARIELGPRLIELGSAIVVPAVGAEPMAELVGGAVAALGAPQPDRPFLGHLTIGRWRRGQATEGLVGRRFDGAFVAATVELLASDRRTDDGDDESSYETVMAWPSPVS